MAKACEFCKKDADDVLTFTGRPICRVCAHNFSHAYPLRENEIPVPMVDAENRVTRYGDWPNIDWS